MRLLSYLLSVLAIGFMVFNATKINFDTPFEKESYTAILTTLAGGCAVLIFTILRVVKKIDRTVKEKS
ncbi:hypothetical protein N8008_02420 [Flavobacteriaceae bacterium]|jgi:hypothetical protein|nr:hypothetical protein [Flavobacteriaceae bacterium]MDA9028528.1 hypothetical protein [Flavobacteriaceae bacterium]MDC1195370.1 hypothetical protein [Flavobacteriaceae bacterium]MDG1384429.1 hypothetical protein [Flavobacteriaceae bacterium]